MQPRSATPIEATTIELTISGETLAGVRVVDTGDATVVLSLALVAVPPAGTAVTMRWPAGDGRGRYAQPATVLSVDENRIEVRPDGDATVEQHRHYVRGGGGERVLLLKPGRPDTLGWVRNLSEQGIRAHFEDVEVFAGDDLRLRVQLDADVIEVPATAGKVAALRQSLPQRGPMSVELVALLTPDEPTAQIIRRYVLRQQLLTRARTAG